MADNTLLNSGTGGDTIRDIDRGTGSKTQVVQLDVGGASTNAESLVSSNNSLPTFDVDLDTYNENTQYQILFQIVTELRVMNQILFEGLGMKGDLDNMRTEQTVLTDTSNTS